MIIDAHYHLESRMQTVDALLKKMDKNSIDRVALIAPLNEPLPWGKIIEISTGELRNLVVGPGPLMSKARDIYASLVTEDGRFVLLGKRYRIIDSPDNAMIAEAMQAHPDRFWAWICVNPRLEEPRTQLEKWTGPGWIGVKGHPFMHRFPVKELDGVAAWCLEMKYPMLVHLGYRERGDYRFLPDKYPALKVIYAHAGVPYYRELWEYARGKPNVFVDLSSPGYVDERIHAAAYKALGADRCLYGTDGPYCNVDHGVMADRVQRMAISQAEKDCILGGNFVGMVAPGAR